MTNSKRKLYTVSSVFSTLNHAKTLELLHVLTDTNSELEITKREIMYDFKDNDDEAQQLIDDIEIQQYYIGKNILTLIDVLLIHETRLIPRKVCFGLNSEMPLN